MAMSRFFGSTSFISFPSMYSSPPEISSRPATIRSVVDLPQPEGPTRTMNSLSLISRLNSWTAMTPSAVTWRLTFFSVSPAFFLPFFCPPLWGYILVMPFKFKLAITLGPGEEASAAFTSPRSRGFTTGLHTAAPRAAAVFLLFQAPAAVSVEQRADPFLFAHPLGKRNHDAQQKGFSVG